MMDTWQREWSTRECLLVKTGFFPVLFLLITLFKWFLMIIINWTSLVAFTSSFIHSSLIWKLLCLIHEIFTKDLEQILNCSQKSCYHFLKYYYYACFFVFFIIHENVEGQVLGVTWKVNYGHGKKTCSYGMRTYFSFVASHFELTVL